MTEILTGASAREVDRLAQSLDRGLVPAAVFGDEQIYREELRKIFGHAWLFLGLEEEVSEVGDYVLRRMGEDEVIVSRGDDNNVHVLLNKCRHRGTVVCRDDRGNTSNFMCPYHGWTYGNDGSWTGAPKRPRAYRQLDRTSWGLIKAPKVEVRWGLIFACLDPDGPSFEEYAGDALWYLRGFFGADSQGLHALGDPNRWITRTNWKSGSENIGGDNYHVATAHGSVSEIGVLPDFRDANEGNAQFDAGNGHGFTAAANFAPSLGLTPFGFTQEVWDSFDKSDLDDDHLKFHGTHFLMTFNFFPNFSVLRYLGAPDPDTGHVPNFMMVRTWQPVGSSQTEVWNWMCVYKAEPSEHHAAAYATGMQMMGPAGLLEQDDMAVWEGTTAAATSVMAEMNGMEYNYQLGLEGMSVGGPADDLPGPVLGRHKSYSEENQRGFFRQWRKMMVEGA